MLNNRSNSNQVLTWPTILVLVTLLLNLVACQGSVSSTNEPPTPTPLPTVATLVKPTYKVEKGEVIELLKFNGRVTPAAQEALFFRTSGRVNKLYAEEGDMVTAGQILADLEGIDDMERQQRLNELDLRKVEIRLETAQLSLDLFKKTTQPWAEGYDELLKMKELDVEMAEIAVEETKLYSQSLEKSLSDSRITAPIDGKLISLKLLEGREVQDHKEVALVADLSILEISAELLAEEMGKLEEGMEATIKTISGKDKEFPASIRRLPYPYGASSSAATSTSEKTETRVSFTVPSDTNGMGLGTILSVEVILKLHEDTLWLPPQAIRVYEGRNFVVVQEGDIQRRVDVKLGIEAEDRVEILDGLKEGDVVQRP